MFAWTAAVGVSWRIGVNGVGTICVCFPGQIAAQAHSEIPMTKNEKERYTIASFTAGNFLIQAERTLHLEMRTLM